MTSSDKVDTFDTVKTKIINNIRSLGNTLQIASEDLRGKGYNVPDGQIYIFSINMAIPSIEPETMIIDLLKRSRHLWDDLFIMRPEIITPKQIEEIKVTLPSSLSTLVSPLLDCRDANDKMALDTKILGLLINYLQAFVKLGLKICYFKRDIYEALLGINLDDELKLRKVVGLPS